MAGQAQQIIDGILASPRLRQSDLFAGRSFADEPIIQRGSQMAGYLPERIREMRELASDPSLHGASSAKLFFRQAQLMEDYVDDAPYKGNFHRYFPTYQSMGDRQLRGYFTWRAKVRQGLSEAAPTSFLFVYIYELICGIGIDEAQLSDAAVRCLADNDGAGYHPGTLARMSRAERGYWVIRSFWERYRLIDHSIGFYLSMWIKSYVIWHNLPRQLIEPYLWLKEDRAYLALRDGIAEWGDQDNGSGRACEEAMYAALNECSNYRPAQGRLGRDGSSCDTLRHVCCGSVVGYARHCERHRKTGLLDGWFGPLYATPVAMFAQAVFWSEKEHPNASYEIDEVNRYECRRGRWYHTALSPSRKLGVELGQLMRACDQRLRAALGYKHPLKERPLPKFLTKIIDAEIETRLAWEREREARAVHVDLSALAGIRAAAATTREALLVDEEREDAEDGGAPWGGGESWEAADIVAADGAQDAAPNAVENREVQGAAVGAGSDAPGEARGTVARAGGEARDVALIGGQDERGKARQGELGIYPAAKQGQDAPGQDGSPTSSLGLSDTELDLLCALLDRRPFAPSAERSLDMLVDGINEKLFDLVGDTVIEFLSGEPAIIADYERDLREAIGHE